MVSADVADRERLDRATNSLMRSLRQSKALNIEIREALQRREQSRWANGEDASLENGGLA
jgi:hypothetical protein